VCQVAKGSIARLVTFKECIYNGLYNNKIKPEKHEWPI
jgi:hypothetical protein